MNAVTEFLDDPEKSGNATLSVSETYWGYIVRERDPYITKLELREIGLIFAGAVLLIVGFGQWLLPGTLISADVLPIKVALMAAFVGVGGACWHGAGSQTEVEVHIDTALREVRIVARDRRGLTQLLQRVPMKSIDSVYVKRGPNPGEEQHLFLQVAESENPLHMATGGEREIRLLHDRLRRDLRPPKERVERRLMREAGVAMPKPAKSQSLSA